MKKLPRLAGYMWPACRQLTWQRRANIISCLITKSRPYAHAQRRLGAGARVMVKTEANWERLTVSANE